MRTPILAIVALVFGLAAAYGTYHYISTRTPNDPEHDVVVVSQAYPGKDGVPPNTILTKDMFEVVKMKQSQIGDPKENGLVIQGVPGRDMTALISNQRRSVVKLQKGKPIQYDLQTAEPGAYGVTAQLKPGEVAVTVATNLNEAGGGLLRPGMAVDIACKFKDPVSQEDKVVILFKKVDVLAVNAFMQPPADQPLSPDRVLLRMTYDDSLRMTYFKTIGTVTVLMRSTDTKEEDMGIGRYNPKTDPVLAQKPKEETSTPTTPNAGGGTNQAAGPDNSQAMNTPPRNPAQPVKPGKIRRDLKLQIFDGSGVRVVPHEEWIDAPPAPGATPPPPAPGTEGKPPSILGNEPKKDEPKKDESGGEAPKPVGE